MQNLFLILLGVFMALFFGEKVKGAAAERSRAEAEERAQRAEGEKAALSVENEMLNSSSRLMESLVSTLKEASRQGGGEEQQQSPSASLGKPATVETLLNETSKIRRFGNI